MQTLCVTKECHNCDFGIVIKDYVKPLIQLLTDDLKDFNMGMLTTKCLNTAVMLMFFYLGQEGLKSPEVCDCSNYNKTSLNAVTNGDALKNNRNVKNLERSILSKNHQKRRLFYILLTDSYFPKPNNETVYFPGHVIVVEKVPGKNLYYNLYQSYINEYDLKGHYKNNKDTFFVSYTRMQIIMKQLRHIMTTDKWDNECVRFWSDLTNVDTQDFLGSTCGNKFFICWHSMPCSGCLENVELYVTKKLQQLDMTENAPVGNEGRDARLSNFEMHKELSKLLETIQKNKTSIYM